MLRITTTEILRRGDSRSVVISVTLEPAIAVGVDVDNRPGEPARVGPLLVLATAAILTLPASPKTAKLQSKGSNIRFFETNSYDCRFGTALPNLRPGAGQGNVTQLHLGGIVTQLQYGGDDAEETAETARERPQVLSKVRQAIESGEYSDLVQATGHAKDRQTERVVTRSEYVHVLGTGYHEKRKDEFKEEFQSWNYSIRGTTIDGRELRVPVSFDDDGTLLIITVIDLEQ